jgi:hypothetical protein
VSNANNSGNGSDVVKRTLRHLRRQIDKCIDVTDEERRRLKNEIDADLAKIGAFSHWESGHVAAQAEIDALQDRAEVEQDSERKLAMLNELTEKLGSWVDGWVEQALQSGMYVERPLSLAEKKQFYLDFALLNNEQREIAAAARALKYGFPLTIKYGIPFQRHEGREAARWLHGVTDALDALNAPGRTEEIDTVLSGAYGDLFEYRDGLLLGAAAVVSADARPSKRAIRPTLRQREAPRRLDNPKDIESSRVSVTQKSARPATKNRSKRVSLSCFLLCSDGSILVRCTGTGVTA